MGHIDKDYKNREDISGMENKEDIQPYEVWLRARSFSEKKTSVKSRFSREPKMDSTIRILAPSSSLKDSGPVTEKELAMAIDHCSGGGPGDRDNETVTVSLEGSDVEKRAEFQESTLPINVLHESITVTLSPARVDGVNGVREDGVNGVMKDANGLSSEAFEDGIFEVPIESGPKLMKTHELMRKPNPLSARRWHHKTSFNIETTRQYSE